MTLALIATGPPGCGKSTTLAALGAGIAVVREAATDVNEELLAVGVERPERSPAFLARIVALQRERRLATRDPVQVHDRSVFCTLALARYLALPVPDEVSAEVAAVAGVFASRVLFFEPLGQIENTPVRRISYEAGLEFAEVHRQVYLDHGFTLVGVPPASPAERADGIRSLVSALLSPGPTSR